MRRVIGSVLVTLLLVTGCSAKKPVSTRNGVEYLHVRGESLADSQRRSAYDGEHVEVFALQGAEGQVWCRSHFMFTLANGVYPPDAGKLAGGFHMTRLWGTIHTGWQGANGNTAREITFSADGWEPMPDVPIRPVTLAEVDADVKAFDGAHVVMEGHYVSSPGLASWLDEKIYVQQESPWLRRHDWVPSGSDHLRVTGWLFTRGGRFGPRGDQRYFLLAEEGTVTP